MPVMGMPPGVVSVNVTTGGLATVTPVQDRRWCSGYRAHEKELVGVTAHPWGTERAQAIDAGLVKERALMATVFTDPKIVAWITAESEASIALHE